MDYSIEKVISDLRSQPPISSPIVIYGASGKGKAIYNLLTGQGYCVDGFIDGHAKPDQVYGSIHFQTPDDWASQHRVEQYTVVVVIHNYSVDMGSLLASIASMGFMRVVNMVELGNLFPNKIPNPLKVLRLRHSKVRTT